MIKHLEKDKVWQTIVKTVNSLVDYISPTYGPAGNKVIVDNKYSPNNPTIADDGVFIAREFQLEDEFENQIVNVIKQVAEKTNSRVGDGTTSSLIILQAIINEVSSLEKIDSRRIVQDLQTGAKEATEQLTKKAKKVATVEGLEKVARISFDNEKIAKVIAGLVHKVGHEGVITIQESNGMEIESEIVDGFEFSKGYISPYMATNSERMEAVQTSVPIFLTDYKFSMAKDALMLMERLLQTKIPRCVLICDGVEGDALATFVVNRMQAKFDVLAIETPGFEEEKGQFLDDLAAVTGARVLKRDLNKLEDFDLSWLGEAERVVSKPENTVIVGGKGKKKDIQKQVTEVKTLMEKSTGYKLEQLQKRLGRLVNGVAVIKVGAPTEHEMRALKYKVEDAVNAVKVAYKSGVVRGGGMALAYLKTSSEILNKALQKPAVQLFENSGMINLLVSDAPIQYIEGIKLEDNAINIVTNKQGDFMEVGVIDPVEVLCAGVESAVSIACLLISTKGLMVNVEDKK